MRLIGLLLTVGIIGYLFFVLFGRNPEPIGSHRAALAEADRALSRQAGPPPATRTSSPGFVIERARQAKEMSRQRVEAADPLSNVGFGQ